MKKLFLLSILALTILLSQLAANPTTTYAADCYAGTDEYGNVFWVDSDSIDRHSLDIFCKVTMATPTGKKLCEDNYHFRKNIKNNCWFYKNHQFNQWQYVGYDLGPQVILNYILNH